MRVEGRAKDADAEHINAESPLSDEKRTAYRAIVARANYLSPDRPDIAYSAKELARGTSTPTDGDWCRLKRLARYLKGKPSSPHA